MAPDSRFNLSSRQVSLRKSRGIAFLLIFVILVQPLLLHQETDLARLIDPDPEPDAPGTLPPAPPATMVLRVGDTPLVDGFIDPVWEEVEAIPLTGGNDAPAENLSAAVRLLHDDATLFLLVDVQNDLVSTGDEASLTAGDAVGILLDGDAIRGEQYDGADDRRLIWRWSDAHRLAVRSERDGAHQRRAG
ncbi:MAG: hypothetical protein KDD92_02700 [Caldilineaceae bacterium]|nr:hypothetical protein [Caldilineaceae bacterium]